MTSNKSIRNEQKINWYPGHMLRAKKQLKERLKQVDVILEVRDARIPLSSKNEDLESVIHQKLRVILFNKTDLADPKVIEHWKQHLDFPHLFIDTQKNQGVSQIIPKAKALMKPRWQRYIDKGIQPPRLRLTVVGIPNVGKSTLINRLAKKNTAETGPRPGVTKQQFWIRIGKDVELLDTPGMLWPRFEDDRIGLKLAVTGAIKDEIVGEYRQSQFLLQHCIKHYPEPLLERYKLPELIADPKELLEHIGKKRGCLQRQGEVDLVRAAKVVLHDFREGKLSQISLEHPEWT